MKKGIFALWTMIIAILLVGYGLLLINSQNVKSEEDIVGGLSLDVFDQELDYQINLLELSKQIDVRGFFFDGASNKDSYVITDKGTYKLWAKKNSNSMSVCYPNEEELLNYLAEFTGAESVEVNRDVVFDFGTYNSEISSEGSIVDYTLKYENNLIIEKDFDVEIMNANEFFNDIKKCGLDETCYADLGGVLSNNVYLFNIDLGKETYLVGAVSLNSGSLLGEDYNC